MDNRVFWSVLSALIVFAGIGAVFFDLVPAVYHPVPPKPLVVYADAGVMPWDEMMRRQLRSGDSCTNTGFLLRLVPSPAVSHVVGRCAWVADRRLR
jgi:hypothetical protein